MKSCMSSNFLQYYSFLLIYSPLITAECMLCLEKYGMDMFLHILNLTFYGRLEKLGKFETNKTKGGPYVAEGDHGW